MYIGLAKNPERRYREHLGASYNPKHRDYNLPIHRAIRKYGIKNFEFHILENDLKDTEEMKDREIYWINYYNTYEDREHYNETPGGDLPGRNTIHLGEEHGMAKLTTEDVKYCRQCYAQGLRSRDIYNSWFKDKIEWSGFEGMWHGKTWKHIMPEVFKTNPHRSKFTAKDRDIIVDLFKKSRKSLKKFSESQECYVGYGTLWKMVNTPSFYDGK